MDEEGSYSRRVHSLTRFSASKVDYSKRLKSSIDKDDVPRIAYMFYVDMMSVIDIARAIGSKPTDVSKVIRGRAMSRHWRSAVSDMVCDGITCSRVYETSSCYGNNDSKPSVTSKHDVLTIREMFSDGKTTQAIASDMDMSISTVRSIVKGRSFKGPEYYPGGNNASHDNAA